MSVVIEEKQIRCWCPFCKLPYWVVGDLDTQCPYCGSIEDDKLEVVCHICGKCYWLESETNCEFVNCPYCGCVHKVI